MGALHRQRRRTPANDADASSSATAVPRAVQRRSGGRGPHAAGHGREFTIVGVLPRDFTFGGPDVRFWIPLALTERQRSDDARHSNGWTSIGRLKPGATIEQVRAQLKALDAVNLERTSPKLKPILINTGFYTSSSPWQTSSFATCRDRSPCSGALDRRARDRSRQPGQPRVRAFADATRRARDTAGHRRRTVRRDPSATRRRTAHRRRRRGRRARGWRRPPVHVASARAGHE